MSVVYLCLHKCRYDYRRHRVYIRLDCICLWTKLPYCIKSPPSLSMRSTPICIRLFRSCIDSGYYPAALPSGPILTCVIRHNCVYECTYLNLAYHFKIQSMNLYGEFWILIHGNRNPEHVCNKDFVFLTVIFNK